VKVCVCESVRGGLVSGKRGEELAKGEGSEERRRKGKVWCEEIKEGEYRERGEERREERVVLMMIKIIS
jgi:hypothetical protein